MQPRPNPLRRLFAFGLFSMVAAAGSAQPLPQHPDIVRGELGNGMDYLILQHDNPKGRAQIYLNVSSGSMNETEQQRGIAHYLEHMAFNGGENFAPGEVVPFFESLGLTFGRHQNAYTSFNETVYILELPDNEIDTLDKGLAFFEDVKEGLLLDETEIEAERQVILNEERTGKGPQQRVRNYVFERIAPGSTFAKRLPIGTTETIQSVQRDDFVDYYSKFYTPNNMTFIAVADMEPWIITDALERRLAEGQNAPPAEDADPLIRPYAESFAIVATDPELTGADVSILRVDAPRDAVTTVPQFRERLVESLAQAAFNRRIDRLIAEDKVSFRSGNASAFDLADTLHIAQASAVGQGEDWRQMLDELAYEYQRARVHGFTAQELADARTDLLASYERFAETEDTLPASVHINRMNAAVASGDTLMSGKQRLELAQELMRDIVASEVSDSFAKAFPQDRVAVVLELPEGSPRHGWIPTEDEALAALNEALDVEPEPWSDFEKADQLMAELPEAGTTVEISHHPEADVWSAWLSNGARLHYRYMDNRENNATISVTLAGGSLFESPDTQGLTDAASVVFGRPATKSLSSTQIKDLMTGSKAGVSAGAAGDAIVFNVSGNPDDFDRAMQLAHLLMTEPQIEQPAFDQWKQATRQQIAQREVLPIGQLQDALMRTILNESEARFFPLGSERLEEITIEDAQEWLRRRLEDAPVEVSIVGDISRARAFDLAEQYIGSLSPRERISPDVYKSARATVRKANDRHVVRELDTQTPQAVVVAGSFGPDFKNREDRYPVRMATQIISSRMIKTIREEEQLVYSIQANSIAVPGYNKMGLIFSVSIADPDKGETLKTRIDDMFTEFAENGPTAEEVEVSYGQVLNTLDENIEQPSFWTGLLSDLTYRDTNLDDVLNYREIYGRYTAEDIRSTFAKYYTEDDTFSVLVQPKGTSEEAAEAAIEGETSVDATPTSPVDE